MSLLSNAKWNSFSQVIKILVQVISLVYLAKIIPPSEYGMMAMASVVTSLGILFRDMGTASAIIQKKNISHKMKNTIFWFNVFMGIVIAILICILSPLISSIYHQPDLEMVLVLISIIFPLSSSAAVHLSLLERESKFKVISFIEISSSVVSITIAIVLANNGFGVYSLVFQAISLNFMSAVQFWFASKWRPTLKNLIDFGEIKDIFSFSANLSLFNIINYFSRNGDSFIIGKYMSVSILGNYNLAYRIMLFPLQSLTFVASRSLYPILSRNQDDNRQIFQTYKICIFIILMLTSPLMSGVALLSQPLINIVFGEQWGLTAVILKYLAPTAIIQAILSTTGAVFSAKGRTDILMKLGILGTVLQFGSFLIGVHYSITTFALCYLIANILNFFPVMYTLLKLISGDFFDFFSGLFPVIISTLVMISFMMSINAFIFNFDKINTFPSLIIVSIVSAFVYLISLYITSLRVRKLVNKKIRFL